MSTIGDYYSEVVLKYISIILWVRSTHDISDTSEGVNQ